MKTSNNRHSHLLTSVAEALSQFVLAAVLICLVQTPALARDRDDDGGHRHWNNGRGNSGHRGSHHGYWGGRKGYRQSPYDWQPNQPNANLYAPPPVYYAPYPSPGINLVLPIHIR